MNPVIEFEKNKLSSIRNWGLRLFLVNWVGLIALPILAILGSFFKINYSSKLITVLIVIYCIVMIVSLFCMGLWSFILGIYSLKQKRSITGLLLGSNIPMNMISEEAFSLTTKGITAFSFAVFYVLLGISLFAFSFGILYMIIKIYF